MINFLKKIFSKKEEQKAKHKKDKRYIQQRIEYLESIAKTNEIQDYEQFVEKSEHFITELEQIDSARASAVQKYMETQLEYTKAKRCEKIVNEYGRAIVEASDQNKSLLRNLNVDLMKKTLQEKRVYYYRLIDKLDIHFLPYSKDTIRDALDFLLQRSQDQPDTYINSLKCGLMTLDDFIDFSHIES